MDNISNLLQSSLNELTEGAEATDVGHQVRRILFILATVVLAHLLVLALRKFSRWFLSSRAASEAKVQTLTGFVTSFAVFALYFFALGFSLRELGISLTAYFASASFIGLALSFGAQGVVQDVITGLTVVFSDLLDVGDLVEIGGQTGIVENVGSRFTSLIGFAGTRIYVPNRNILQVINYPRGFVRVYIDVRLPAEASVTEQAETDVRNLAADAHRQFSGIILTPPIVVGRTSLDSEATYVRVKLRAWPNQNPIVEGAVKQSIIAAMKKLDAAYADWMVAVHYRVEPATDDPSKRLPQPAAIAKLRANHPKEPD